MLLYLSLCVCGSQRHSFRPPIPSSVCPSVQPEWLGMPPDGLPSPCRPACFPQCQPGSYVPKKFPLHRPQIPVQAGSALHTHRLVEDWIITGGPGHRNLEIRWHERANTLAHWHSQTLVRTHPSLFFRKGEEDVKDSSIRHLHHAVSVWGGESPYFPYLSAYLLHSHDFTVNWAKCKSCRRGFPSQFVLFKGSGKESPPGWFSFFVVWVHKGWVIVYPQLLFSCELFDRKKTALTIRATHIQFVIDYSLPETKLHFKNNGL